MRFHTFTQPEDSCVRLLMKNLGRNMPESVVREQLESLDIHVQGVMQLRSGIATRTPPRTTLTLHCIVGAGASGIQSAIIHRTLWPTMVGGIVRGAKSPTAMKALAALRTHAT